jgi:hypothetical protein
LYSCSTPSTSSSVAAPGLHLQQQLHQKQSIPGEEITVETKTKDQKKRKEQKQGHTKKPHKTLKRKEENQRTRTQEHR